jgi:hypothetical protein
MPTEHVYDEQTRMMTTRIWGTVTDADLLALAESIASDPRIAPGMRELMDLREVEKTEVTRQVLQSVAAIDRTLAENFLGNRTAIVAVRDAHYGLARMFAHLMEAAGAPTQVRVFRDVDMAKGWLQRPAASGTAPAAPPA